MLYAILMFILIARAADQEGALIAGLTTCAFQLLTPSWSEIRGHHGRRWTDASARGGGRRRTDIVVQAVDDGVVVEAVDDAVANHQGHRGRIPREKVGADPPSVPRPHPSMGDGWVSAAVATSVDLRRKGGREVAGGGGSPPAAGLERSRGREWVSSQGGEGRWRPWLWSPTVLKW